MGLASGPRAEAQTMVWLGYNPSWATYSNWSPDAVPNSTAAEALIDSSKSLSGPTYGDSATLAINIVLNNLTFDSLNAYTNTAPLNFVLTSIPPYNTLTFAGSSPSLTMTAAYNGTATINSPIILGSSLLISNNGTSAGPQLILEDTVDLAGNNVTFSGTSNTSVSGSITDSVGAGNLTLSSGVLILNGVNTYTGLTTVSAGTLLLSGAGTLGAATAALTVNGGNLDLGGTTPNNIGTVTISGGNIQNGTLTSTADYAGQSGTVSAILGGTVGLNKTAGGTLILSGANTYTGATSVSAGTLELNGPNGAPSVSNTNTLTINNGGTLLTDTSGQLNAGVKLVLNGGTWATNALNSTSASAQAAFTANLNTLTLTATSNLTLGNGSGSATNTINFAASQSVSWTPGQILYINHWTGEASNDAIAGGGGQDEIIFGNSPAGLSGGQLGEIIFVNPQDAANGMTGASGNFSAVILPTGEVVPYVVAPEPGTVPAGAALAALALLREWRRRKSAQWLMEAGSWNRELGSWNLGVRIQEGNKPIIALATMA